MKVTALSGSPLKRGNVARLIEMLLKEIGASGKYEIIPSMYMVPCQECEACIKTGSCIIKSDKWSTIAKSMLKSDLIIIGSPVYFYGISGPLKTFLDRTYCLWHKRRLKGKKVILCTVNSRGTDEALDSLRLWAQIHEMKIIAAISVENIKSKNIEKDKNTQQEIKKVKKLFK
ncbi:MAG: flavodoxin family protein [Methanomicrobiales archaeon]|nr:flavodoxin family protein [Methanomicrobiales archaeon]